MLGRCLDPRNLRPSGDTIARACGCFDFDIVVVDDFNVDFEEEEFVRLPPPPTGEPRRDDDDGDAIASLSSSRCRDRELLRLLNLRRLNDGIIDFLFGREDIVCSFLRTSYI